MGSLGKCPPRANAAPTVPPGAFTTRHTSPRYRVTTTVPDGLMVVLGMHAPPEASNGWRRIETEGGGAE